MILGMSFKVPVLCKVQYLTKKYRSSVAELDQSNDYSRSDFDTVQLQINTWRVKYPKCS